MQEDALNVRVRILAFAGGCVEGVVLSRAMALQESAGEGEWWSCTLDDWCSTLNLGSGGVERSRRRLRQLGVLEEERRGIPARLFYRIDLDEIERRVGGENGQT